MMRTRSALLSLALLAASASRSAAADKTDFIYTLPVTVKLTTTFQDSDKSMGSAKGVLILARGQDTGEIRVGDVKVPVHVSSFQLAAPQDCTPAITSWMWENRPDAVTMTPSMAGPYRPQLEFEIKTRDLQALAKQANRAWYRTRSTHARADQLVEHCLSPQADPYRLETRLNDADWLTNELAIGPIPMASGLDYGCHYQTSNTLHVWSISGSRIDTGVTIELKTAEIGKLVPANVTKPAR